MAGRFVRVLSGVTLAGAGLVGALTLPAGSASATVPPFPNQLAQLSAADGATGDGFGTSVSISGTTAVVGAPHHAVNGNAGQGVAYVFTESLGKWKQSAELDAPDGAAADAFGATVSISGTVIVVGAPAHDVNGNVGQGAAYAFAKSGANWVATEITAPDGASNDAFGTDVALYDGTTIVGAPGHATGGATGVGAAYLFAKSGSAWKQQAELTDPGQTDGAGFGAAVAIYASTAAVGSPTEVIQGSSDSGAAYTYTKSGATWKQTDELDLGVDSGPYVGSSVALYGSTLAVGARGSTGNGAFYVYSKTGPGLTWTRAGTMFLNGTGGAGGGTAGGFSVAVSGSALVVGAPNDGIGEGGPAAGQAFDWTKAGDPNSWRSAVNLDDGTTAGDEVGYAVALSGSTALVGAPGLEVGTNPGQGSVGVYDVRQGCLGQKTCPLD